MSMVATRRRGGVTLGLLFLAATALAACGDPPHPQERGFALDETVGQVGAAPPQGQRRAYVLGANNSVGPGEVNGYLWRASLDTVSFMPIASADPYGGAIITDWYAPPETPEERFKLNIILHGREFRSDGVRVTVFRQARDATGEWVDSAVDKSTAVDIENVILQRARELRQQVLNQ